MTGGEILKQVEGLTHDKLTYFVRAGYLHPKKIKRGSLDYNKFTEKDLALVKRAWDYIKTYDMKTKAAFDRARAELTNPQMTLFSR